MAPTEHIDLDRELDRLYQRPLDEFVDARNALAKRLKAAGRSDDAGRVKTLAKPPVSAWAVSQVYWQEREAYDEAVEAGDALRAAQQASLSGKPADMKAAMLRRQAAVTAMTERAAALLAKDGTDPGSAIVHRIAVTADAIAAWGSLDGAPDIAHLDADVSPPGLAALAQAAGLVAGPGRPKSTPARPPAPASAAPGPAGTRPAATPAPAVKPPASRPDRPTREDRQREAEAVAARRRVIADAEAALRTGQAALRAAEDEHRRASDTARLAERASASAAKTVAELEARLSEAREKDDAARERHEEATARVEAAERERRRFEAEVETRTQALQRLRSEAR